MKTILKTIDDIMFRPKHFFDHLHTHGIKEPLKFLVIVSLFTQFFLIYYVLSSEIIIPIKYFGLNYTISLERTLFTFLILYAAAVIWTIFFNFLWPLLSHFFIKLFNRRATYKNTYKSLIYGNTPNYIAVPFFLIIVALGFSMLVINKPILLILLVISLAIWIGAECYSVVLRLMFISQTQKISIWKSLLCVYVFPMIILFIIEFFLLGTIIFFNVPTIL